MVVCGHKRKLRSSDQSATTARGMASDRDSEDEALEHLGFDEDSDGDEEIDEDILDAIEGDLAAEEAASEEVVVRA